ncbi:MAG: nucleoside triphosphate pyrophosphohydrolase [Bacteroidota bacterium]
MQQPDSLHEAFDKLVSVVHELREKCPWDKKQTFDSLRHLTIEETHELADTIIQKDYSGMHEELGDLLLHIIFYARIGQEQAFFDLTRVIQTQTEKLIRRHPHIYGEVKADTEAEVLANWEKIKAEEKKKNSGANRPKSTLEGVPSSLPALIQAYRVQEKVANVGFEWEKVEEVVDKINEEIAEFNSAQTAEERESEMGDLLFSLVNYCRFVGINPDDALMKTNLKFKRRFMEVEKSAFDREKDLSELSLEEMEAAWQRAKSKE